MAELQKMFAFCGKSGPSNTIVTSDSRPQVEIWLYHACAMKNMQYNPYLTAESLKFPYHIGNRG